MRYRDPESRPANYNPRGHDTRARYRRGGEGGRWEHDAGRGRDERSDRQRGDDRRGEDDRKEGRRWDADRWDRAAPTFERATDRWDMGRAGDGAAAAREALGGLAARLGARPAQEAEGLDYGEERAVEIDREVARDGGVGGRNARAAAWVSARAPSPGTEERERSRETSGERERDERSMSAGSDMVMDRDD